MGQKVRAEHPVERLQHRFAVLAAESELLQLEVIHALVVRNAQHLGHRGRQIGSHLRHIAAALNKGGAVVRRGQRRQ